MSSLVQFNILMEKKPFCLASDFLPSVDLSQVNKPPSAVTKQVFSFSSYKNCVYFYWFLLFFRLMYTSSLVKHIFFLDISLKTILKILSWIQEPLLLNFFISSWNVNRDIFKSAFLFLIILEIRSQCKTFEWRNRKTRIKANFKS